MAALRPGLRAISLTGRGAVSLAPPARRSAVVAHLGLAPRARVQAARHLGTTSRRLDAAPHPATPPPSQSSTQSNAAAAMSAASTRAKERSKSAYARFKDLTKKYGKYAVIMYVLLSTVDFSIAFAGVHAVGAERVGAYLAPAIAWYRRTRFGEERALEIEAEERDKAAADQRERAEGDRKGKNREWYQDPKLWAEAALAYGIHKTLLLPIRAGLTVAWTPRVVEGLRARGWIAAAKKVA